jgi:hypothetical protein
LWGKGKLGYKNNTEYVTVYNHKKFNLDQVRHVK